MECQQLVILHCREVLERQQSDRPRLCSEQNDQRQHSERHVPKSIRHSPQRLGDRVLRDRG